jgi:hypothetical protein
VTDHFGNHPNKEKKCTSTPNVIKEVGESFERIVEDIFHDFVSTFWK